MHPARLLFLISVLIGSACRALYIPHDLHDIIANSYDKRSRMVIDGYRPDKREFNADDLTLRFGKRGDAAFHPDDLALRFGR
ncbi:hypothetical protein OESDEN_00079 [Oesophagostomum dentatum]|uniref:Uncharacterized protein n=1 Tax=Oesophagostomum dentatum TaxID=61180 RepID=A0A0B1TRI4_OESDE|nr:hypothetical protein OESDEN_00079 [Oesophagostomum dentatum]